MHKRIVIGSFQIESNSLTAIQSTRGDFSIAVGEEMLERVCVSGYFAEKGYDVIPTVYASAVPGGSMVQSDFQGILRDMLDRIPKSPVDGVWLFLHGAMDVQGIGSGDLEIARAVRERVGAGVPIAVALDLHANIDPRIASYVNVVCGFRTAPHVDIERTQLHAAELLIRCIAQHFLPKPIVVKLPIIASGDSMTTDIAPGKDIIDRLWAMEEAQASMCLNVFLGNPWVDSACAGGAVVVVPNDGREAEAERQALELARMYWDRRGEFRFRARTADVEEGIRWALSNEKRPLFVSDTGDNVSGGASGDNAELLRRVMLGGVRGALFAGIADEPVVKMCASLEPGDAFDCTLGGALDPGSASVAIRAVLKARGVIHSWPACRPVASVLVHVCGNDVIVAAERTPVVHMAVFSEFGIRPEEYRFVVVKLGYLWPEFYDAAADSIMLMTPGSTCEVVERCAFHRIPRPVYPIDRDMAWIPSASSQTPPSFK